MAWSLDSSAARPRGVLLAVALAAAGAGASAQELEPRAYANTPVGLNFLLAGYGYAAGSIGANPSIPLKHAKVHVHGTVLTYARTLDVWGKSGKLGLIVPYAWASGSAELAGQRHQRHVSGFGDPQFRFSVNLHGAPALSLKEFASYRQDLIVGASLQVSAPLGQYDDDRLLNIGANRWSIKPELGISKALGPLTLELTGSVSLYTDNNDFFGGHTRAQDPLYAVQGHAIYSLRSGIWAALDGIYYAGGRTTIDGMEDADRQSNTRLGLTVALPVNRYNSVKLNASTGVSSRTGGDFDAVGVAWQYRWGAGL
jgi:hypothetical protein